MTSSFWTCIHGACALVIMLGFPAMAQALPICSSVLGSDSYEDRLGPVEFEAPRPDCAINWVQNGEMLRIGWTPSEDFDVVELRDLPDGTQVLAASRQPHLIDIDQDGWLDVAVFSLIGMVNGDYDVFRYDPDTRRFVSFGTLWGSSFWRHEDGYLVAAGRSSAAASSVEAVRISNDGFVPQFGLYVDAGQQTGPDGAPECRVSVDGQDFTNPTPAQIAKIFPDAPELIASYCDLYGRADTSGTPLMDIAANPVIVPDGTVFYCQLQGTTKAVTVTRDETGFHYAFGPMGAAPELALSRSFDQVTVLPDNGAGPTWFGHIEFENGNYEYSVFYSYERFHDDGRIRDRSETFVRGLVVYKDNNVEDPAFFEYCDPNLSADHIERLDRS